VDTTYKLFHMDGHNQMDIVITGKFGHVRTGTKSGTSATANGCRRHRTNTSIVSSTSLERGWVKKRSLTCLPD